MNETLKDLAPKMGRYALTAGLTYLTAAGWINEGIAAMAHTIVVDVVGYGVASLFPAYVAYKAFRDAAKKKA